VAGACEPFECDDLSGPSCAWDLWKLCFLIVNGFELNGDE